MSSTSANSRISPAYITATRRHIWAMTPMSCDTNSTPMPWAATVDRISSRICACTVTSRPVVGSSAISSRGAAVTAMAIITRWFMPPESWCG